MATRPRRGARLGGGVRPVYEDFRPESEWRQDDDYHILTIHVPGFMKEQLKVTTEPGDIIRVRGERLVAGNKWSRFLEDFGAPENCELTSIRAKYEGGTLIITVPRKIVPKVVTEDGNKGSPQALSPISPLHKGPRELEPRQSQENVLSEVTPPVRSSKPDIQKTLADYSSDKTSQDYEEKTLEKREGPKVLTGDAKPKTRQDDEEKTFEKKESPKASTGDPWTQTNRVDEDKTIEKKKSPETELKPVTSENVVDKTGKKILGTMKLEKDAVTVTSQETNEEKASKGKQTISSGDAIDKYKKAVKGISGLNEERQLLVNMGSALLVIVALTAYVSYNFATKDAKN